MGHTLVKRPPSPAAHCVIRYPQVDVQRAHTRARVVRYGHCRVTMPWGGPGPHKMIKDTHYTDCIDHVHAWLEFWEGRCSQVCESGKPPARGGDFNGIHVEGC